MATVEERLKLKRVLIDTWSIKEQLCLASSVLKSGDQNWMSVSRSLRPFAEPSRPADWYSQKSCAVQYSSLLDYVGTQKRKKRTDKGSEMPVETPGESIVKKLTQERITELTNILNTQRNQYLKLKEDIRLLKSGQLDDRLDEFLQEIEDEKLQKEKDAQSHIQWLKEREEKKLELERAWKPTKPSPLRTKLQKSLHRRNSSQSEPSSEAESTMDSPQSEPMQVDSLNVSGSGSEEIPSHKTPSLSEPIKEEIPKPPVSSLTPTSPLLTNLLKSPSPALSSQSSILHTAITSNKGPTPSNISLLLNTTSSTPENQSPPTTVSSSLKNLVTNAIDSAEEAAHKPPAHVTHVSPSAGAPTLSMLLELPPSVPGKPLPQLPQAQAPITPHIDTAVSVPVEIKEENKVKDQILEDVPALPDDLPENISVASPDSIPDTPKPEVVEILLEEVIANEDNLLDEVSMEDIESAIESVEQKDKLLAEVQALELAAESLPSPNLPTPTKLEMDPSSALPEPISLKHDNIPPMPLEKFIPKEEEDRIEKNKPNDLEIKSPNHVEKFKKDASENVKYEEVEIVTAKADGDSNIEEDSPILDAQSIADMEVIILGKSENNLILKDNTENDQVVTLIVSDGKESTSEIPQEIKSEESKETHDEKTDVKVEKSDEENKNNSKPEETKKEVESESVKSESKLQSENISSSSSDENKQKIEEVKDTKEVKEKVEKRKEAKEKEEKRKEIKEKEEKRKELKEKEEKRKEFKEKEEKRKEFKEKEEKRKEFKEKEEKRKEFKEKEEKRKEYKEKGEKRKESKEKEEKRKEIKEKEKRKEAKEEEKRKEFKEIEEKRKEIKEKEEKKKEAKEKEETEKLLEENKQPEEERVKETSKIEEKEILEEKILKEETLAEKFKSPSVSRKSSTEKDESQKIINEEINEVKKSLEKEIPKEIKPSTEPETNETPSSTLSTTLTTSSTTTISTPSLISTTTSSEALPSSNQNNSNTTELSGANIETTEPAPIPPSERKKSKSPQPSQIPLPVTPVALPQVVALRSETPSTEDDRTNDATEQPVTTFVGRTTRKRTRANTPVDSKPNSPAFGNNDEEKEYRVWKKSIMLLYSRLSAHKYASLFLKPITDDQAPGYSSFVYRPIDLPTIKKNIETGQTRTTAEFQRDVMVMFTNAIMYNNTKHHVHKMAKQMQTDCMQHIQDFLATQVLANTPGAGDSAIGQSTPTSRRETRETNKHRDFVGLDDASSSSSGSGQGDTNLVTPSSSMSSTSTPLTGKRKRNSIANLGESLERSGKKRKC